MQTPSAPRRAHSKSRTGCIQCKKQHVKCDEAGPPCSNCRLREVECTYKPLPPPSASTLRRRRAKAAAEARAAAEDTSGSAMSPASSSSISVVGAGASTWPLDAPSPLAFSSTPPEDRYLELELMHRWSTRTFSMFQNLPTDIELIQVGYPRIAMREDFLMSSIFSLTALDMALYSSDAKNSQRYFKSALLYSDRASRGLRSRLGDVTGANVKIIYYAASAVAHFNFLLTAGHKSALYRLGVLNKMMVGAVKIAMSNYQSFTDGNTTVTAINDHLHQLAHEIRPIDVVDPETRVVLERLASVVKAQTCPNNVDDDDDESPKKPLKNMYTKYSSSSSPPPSSSSATTTAASSSAAPDPPPPPSAAMYERVVRAMQTTYAVDSAQFSTNFCMYFFAVAGPDFAAAAAIEPTTPSYSSSPSPPNTTATHGDDDHHHNQYSDHQRRPRSDPLALFVLMHLAVLLYRTSHQPQGWWLKDLGRDLAEEISELLGFSSSSSSFSSSSSSPPLVSIPDVRENMAWIRRQVGLVEEEEEESQPQPQPQPHFATTSGRYHDGDEDVGSSSGGMWRDDVVVGSSYQYAT